MDKTHKHDYAVSSLRCFACAAVSERAEEMRKRAGDQPMPGGIYWSARLAE